MKKKKNNKKIYIRFKENKFFELLNKYYIGYTCRVIIFSMLFFITIISSILIFISSFSVKEAKFINFQENGNIDYRVNLKPNEFYEQNYLEKNLVYISKLIKNIDMKIDYRFLIEEPVDGIFSYEILGKLVIAGDQGKNILYQKDYVLKEKKEISNKNQKMFIINDSISVDYDFYNNVAASFKSAYNVDAISTLNIFVRINKKVSENSKKINIQETKDMNLSIPLTQKTLNIKLSDTGINATRNIMQQSKETIRNGFKIFISIVLLICSVACILKTLELLFLLVPKKSKYDTYINKLLNEYDRLIVETPTEPRFDNKEIIKINKFDELLDARDNLKRPIMYYNLIKHEKSYFYIEKENTVYLLKIKAVDIEYETKK